MKSIFQGEHKTSPQTKKFQQIQNRVNKKRMHHSEKTSKIEELKINQRKQIKKNDRLTASFLVVINEK